jgi:UDP-N-acetylglucosamine 2-epimerase (non-hydrolysing)
VAPVSAGSALPGRQRILLVAGTRPEAIKLAPVVLRLRREPELFDVRVCATGQHREMLASALSTFGLRPDVDLDLMRPGQTLNGIAAGVFDGFERVLAETAPDWVLVQGDTTTAMAAAVAAFHRHVRVGHVEAGLRTHDFDHPFPEEMNRRVVDLVCAAHFAPTPRSAAALRREGTGEATIHVTGNTVVDALEWIAAHAGPGAADEPAVLITVHRRESFGEPLEGMLRAVERLARRFPEVVFRFPVHPNPNVRDAVAVLRGIANVHLTEPVDYLQLVTWLRSCRLVLTDSGGIQEEAPTFGKPTLVLRRATERPEGVEAGVAKLVGTDEEQIFAAAERLLTDAAAYAAMAQSGNPYGDGKAADRIADVLAGRAAEPFEPARRSVSRLRGAGIYS